MSKITVIPDEVIIDKIYLIRGKKVMIDRDLADLFGIETKVLKQAVRRNPERFPEDFMFEMSQMEFESWRKGNIQTIEDRQGLRYTPFCFTEQGVTMLSCVLNSSVAIEVNIKVIRIFTRLREMLISHKDILIKLDQLERQAGLHDDKIKIIFDCLKELLNPKTNPMREIGFKRNNK